MLHAPIAAEAKAKRHFCDLLRSHLGGYDLPALDSVVDATPEHISRETDAAAAWLVQFERVLLLSHIDALTPPVS